MFVFAMQSIIYLNLCGRAPIRHKISFSTLKSTFHVYHGDKQAPVVKSVSHWDSVLDYFDANKMPYTSEPALHGPFPAAYLNGLNHAIIGDVSEDAVSMSRLQMGRC